MNIFFIKLFIILVEIDHISENVYYKWKKYLHNLSKKFIRKT